MLVVGASPGFGVQTDTKLFRDILNNFKQQYNKQTLTIRFPEVLQQLQGTDTKIEIITSSMLQPMTMGIGGYRVVDAYVYIFVQTHLQGEDLPPIEYVNAEKRAENAVKLFRDALKIAPEKIKVIRNASKAEILKLFSVLDMKAYN